MILRQEMNVPILMLTARDDEIDRVIGLEIGADDYYFQAFQHARADGAGERRSSARVRLLRQEAEIQSRSRTEGDLALWQPCA